MGKNKMNKSLRLLFFFVYYKKMPDMWHSHPRYIIMKVVKKEKTSTAGETQPFSNDKPL